MANLQPSLSHPKPKIFIFSFVILTILVGLAWAISSPIGSSPDEDAHIGSIWCANGISPGVCEVSASSTLDNGFGRLPFLLNICYKFDPSLSANCGSHDGFENVRLNLENYPSIFYKVMHLFIGHDPVNSIIHMRLFNFCLTVLLIGFAISLSPKATRTNLALIFLMCMIPLGIFTISSINPSSWAIAGIASFTIFLLNFMQTRSDAILKSKALNAFGLIISAAIAIGTRPDSKIYLSLLSIIFVSSKFIFRFNLKQLAGILALALVSMIILQDKILKSVDTFPHGERSGGLSLFIFNLPRVSELWFGNLGANWGLGWLDTPIPLGIAALSIAIFSHFIIENFKYSTLQSQYIFGIGIVTLFSIILVTLQVNSLVVGEQLQPRYFLPFLTAICLAFAYDSKFNISTSKPQFFIYFSALVLTQSYALYINLKRYITGIDSRQFSLDSRMEWWQNSDWYLAHVIPPNLVWIIGSTAFGLLVCTCIMERDRIYDISHS